MSLPKNPTLSEQIEEQLEYYAETKPWLDEIARLEARIKELESQRRFVERGLDDRRYQVSALFGKIDRRGTKQDRRKGGELN